MLSEVDVRRAGPADVDAAVATLHAAFRHDLISSWIFPEDGERELLHPGFMRMFVELAMAAGEVYLAGDGDGVAVWFPVSPDDHGDPEFVEQVAAHCGPGHAPRFRALDESMSKYHPADEPHLYLNFLAVRPQRQGQGVGTALLRDRFVHLDAEGLPSYLEASSARSAALYAREGFKHSTTFALPYDGPTLYPMWRPAPTR
jgi:GNAT superfamily N-acetyltransferase